MSNVQCDTRVVTSIYMLGKAVVHIVSGYCRSAPEMDSQNVQIRQSFPMQSESIHGKG